MSIPPTEVVAGGWYRADDGEERLVWIIREGRVFYFSRDEPERPWTCPPPEAAPPLDRFAAEVILMHTDGAEVAARAAEDAYGSGDW